MPLKFPNKFKEDSDTVEKVNRIYEEITGIKIGNGFSAYKIPHSKGYYLVCLAADEPEWEHVSCYKFFNTKRLIPSWEDMCLVKDLFWDDEDSVIQFHPPKSEYVNKNEFCLHLWRYKMGEIERPKMGSV